MFHAWTSRRRRAYERELERAGKLNPVRADDPPTPDDGGPPFRGGPPHRGDGGEEPADVIADAADRDRARGRVTPHREGGPGGHATGERHAVTFDLRTGLYHADGRAFPGPREAIESLGRTPIANSVHTRRPRPRGGDETGMP